MDKIRTPLTSPSRPPLAFSDESVPHVDVVRLTRRLRFLRHLFDLEDQKSEFVLCNQEYSSLCTTSVVQEEYSLKRC